MSNNFTTVCNLTKDPEATKFGEREVIKIRCACNTYGKNSEPRFFNAVLSGPDFAAGQRLRSGDQVVLSGQLIKTSYKSKNGKTKGQTVESDEMPYAKLLQVTKSPTFFAQDDGDAPPDGSLNSDEPDLGTGDVAPGMDLDL